ncbi:MAG: PilT/PilU family type 4a pilus ATPase [Bacteroidetes bacterium]|nr:PilT/PilU family type 4a pilus ATPase [Rhodothermia bacterium]MCS7155215.1 PilT/PilU family type 4a pilus ATPase [Bacteroidota bacterium]MCX7907800.1 PilT/PilU family type 4a pilus ATPase [Bacteroidota bacterium]MDW8138619.1 PilT/PilU family type 4a pilus ATPase [Bacteroidota bacterium]MDW8284795.1 PilT/PilU family type 4a pilus ATPase [Bacteroidota bacterium]
MPPTVQAGRVLPGNAELPDWLRQRITKLPPHVTDLERIRRQADELEELPESARADLRTIVHALMRDMLERQASDIDLGGRSSNGYIWYRIDGAKRPRPEMGRYSPDEANWLILSITTQRIRERLYEKLSADFSLEIEHQGRLRRFRAAVYVEDGYLALNIRALPEQVRPLESLGFHPNIIKHLLFEYVRDGLTLVTGVTGSGKSTTLDAIIEAHNQTSDAHIVILGEPIEYVHTSKRCLIRHREVGRDVRSFKEGTIQALRQDPDIIVIGEMRDPDTIMAALEVTDSGHKVFSTLHTCSAVESIDRIIAECPPEEQDRVRNRLADVLRVIISQKLCPKIGGGRVLAKEVLLVTPAVKAAIKNNNTAEIYQMIWEGGAVGMITMEQDLFRLYRQRQIAWETAMNFANHKRRLQQLLQQAEG